MPDRPTREYVRLTSLALDGEPLEITSAELCRIQHWAGDEPAQVEWEIRGRTKDERLRDGTRGIDMAAGDRRYRGRVIVSSSASGGLTVFEMVVLGDLVES